ncbi:5309_t:CDS:2 [Gigaspora margarita]|uniref:5309_t:CDS:1 n=1 Tax=Gigaspora margarita TaxID=4874 RepID=A0ABN7VTR3_GIGMA|nr:5309_t:CDS:2 [Gigaspora margarita]
MKSLLKTLFITLAIISCVLAFPFEERNSKEIHVSAPGPGPWAVGSKQAISWWSNNIPSDAKVVAEIKCDDKEKCGTGTIYFKIGSDWDTKVKYYAYVYLEDDKSCYGKGGEFTLISSYGYGYGEKKEKY